jgi:hypothetical protein
MAKPKKGKKDLDPKARAKNVKGGIQVSDTVFNELSPNDRQNLKKATSDLTQGKINPK